MEDTLRVVTSLTFLLSVLQVLILVLMEDTLRAIQPPLILAGFVRLNPCFNGRYSQRTCRQVP